LWRREAQEEQCRQRRRRSNHHKEDKCHRNVRRSDLDIRQHGSNHEDDRQFTQSFQLLIETEDRTRHIGWSGSRIRRLFLGARPGMLDIRAWRDLTMLALDPSHR
jgi:hypothetical protein